MVYDKGEVYYSFHPDFEKDFKDVVKQWSARKAQCPRYSGHMAVFPNDNPYYDPEDSGSDVPDDDENTDERQSQETRGGKQQHRRHRSSISQPEQHVSSPQYDATNLWTSQEPEDLHRLKTNSDDFERVSDPSHRAPPAPNYPATRQGEVTRSSSKMPVSHQPHSTLPVESQDVRSQMGSGLSLRQRDAHEHKSRAKFSFSKLLGGS